MGMQLPQVIFLFWEVDQNQTDHQPASFAKVICHQIWILITGDNQGSCCNSASVETGFTPI